MTCQFFSLGHQIAGLALVEQTKANGLRFKSPKTKHGRRSISLPVSTVTDLRAHWKSQQQQRLALGIGKSSPADLVFPTWDGAVRSPNALTKEWSVAMRALRLTATFHSLRHTHASHLIASGLDVITISRRLGHGSPSITLGVHGHLFPNTDARAAEIMEASFQAARTEREQNRWQSGGKFEFGSKIKSLSYCFF